ncbi:hypothetical protein QYE76_007874 [Lolium multiflorum]|uniref:No apical meristem-associated C-terminal domain-containing protein n=1 Tax=Lolium multiflorum TaxID=4521 RepID=A0AAD8VEE1_LOLMU|nr:hypothetical protein QYE76_007874 [Lolium multiflorum]
MDGRARYSPEFGDSDMTVDNNAPFSPDSMARGSGAFRFPDLNDSPDLRRTEGHVTDSIGLPRHLFPDDGRHTHQVIGSAFGVSMGQDEIAGEEEILNGIIRGHAYEPPVDDYEEEADEDEGEEEVQEELINAETGASVRRTRKRSAGTHGPRWRSLEDECLIEAWKQVSFCPITGANQTGGKYYKRILDCFNEKKNYGDYATIEMNRNEGVLSHRWNLIKAACNKFHGYYEKIRARKESADASIGRPIGNKKAKADRNAAPVLAAMDASIEKMTTSFSVENKEAADRGAIVWKAILDKQDAKIELERERVEEAKMEAHAAAMKATNEATQLSLAKMSQESKILMADMEKMDPLARAWHEMYRKRIGQEVMAARAASASPPAPSTSCLSVITRLGKSGDGP